MPYVKQGRREELVRSPSGAKTPGELTYELTALVDSYIYQSPRSFEAMAESIGALECTKLEFYRRVAVPYEDEKLTKNGDVYLSAPYEDCE